MTMELEVKNKSTVYVAEITVMNMVGNEPHPETETHVLKPGESKDILVWIDHYLVVKEIGELKLEEDLPPENGEPITNEEKQTDEERLYSEKTMKVEGYNDGFMLANYGGPAVFCGVSMQWKSDPIISDPFPTKEGAVKAGLAS